jgi:pimeloyl-ACP methyl ester carboxylesterase
VNRQGLREIRKGFVYVQARHVHYRVAGDGPPVVLLHDSPRSSLLHTRLLREFNDEFTVYALDTPGYGQSDPLPQEPRPDIDDFGDALAATLEALGLAGATVYSYHTSSKIALACALRHPAAIGQLLIDGISVPQQLPGEGFIARYMSPFIPDASGAYLAEQWTKMRDLHRFFPWFDIGLTTRMPTDEPTPLQLHEYALDLFSAGAHYSSAYSAAMRFAARPILARLAVPTTVMARRNDVLFGFLDAVEKLLPACGRIERLSSDDLEWRQALRRLFRSTCVGSGAAAPEVVPPPGLRRRYQRVDGRDILVREAGAGRATVVLHAPPGSSADLDAVLRVLSESRRVWAPDLPGCNLSDALALDATSEEWVAFLIRAIDEAGLSTFDLVAVGLSAPIALAVADAAGPRVGGIVIDGGIVVDAARRQSMAGRYSPTIVPAREGSHFWEVFQRLRDEELQWPWFDGSVAARRGGGDGLNADRLHRRLVATLMQSDTYADACRIALQMDPVPLLRRIGSRILFLERSGDPYYADVPASSALARASSILATQNGLVGDMAGVMAFLDAESQGE